MTFLYLSCIEIALIYLLNIPKELFKRYIGMSLFVNGVVMMISSSLLLQDILFLESLCFFLFYSLKRRITEILFYLSFLLVVKDIIIIFPFYTLISFIIYMTVMALLVYIKQRYPIDNQNIYWSLLMMISLSTLCIYHILYYDFLEILGCIMYTIVSAALMRWRHTLRNWCRRPMSPMHTVRWKNVCLKKSCTNLSTEKLTS